MVVEGRSGGTLFVVVGPSGVGKDSVLDFARDRLSDDPRIQFVTRTVTRPSNGGEDHASMTEAEFASAAAGGAFAVTWAAHGLSYGVPAGVLDHLSDGGVAVCNGSRAALAAIRAAFADVVVVQITARPEIVAERLHGRGREDAQAIAMRIARSKQLEGSTADIEIDNSGAIEVAGEVLIDVITARARKT